MPASPLGGKLNILRFLDCCLKNRHWELMIGIFYYFLTIFYKLNNEFIKID